MDAKLAVSELILSIKDAGFIFERLTYGLGEGARRLWMVSNENPILIEILRVLIFIVPRLLARVLKEGVQFWYNDTSTVKSMCVCVGGGGGGARKRSSGKPLKFTLLHVSICSKLVRNFSNTLGFVSLCRYASLLNYDIFIQPGTPSN
jgi:hypothetical protein